MGKFSKLLSVFGGATAILVLSSPLQAQDGTRLDCMAAVYSDAEIAEIEAMPSIFEPSTTSPDSPNARLSELSGAATAACIVELDWSQDAAVAAAIYEWSRLFEAVYRASGSLTEEQLTLIDAALAEGDRSDLWVVVEKRVMASFDGVEVDSAKADNRPLGLFMIGAGLGQDLDTATKLGELLGMMALQRVSGRRFAASQLDGS